MENHEEGAELGQDDDFFFDGEHDVGLHSDDEEPPGSNLHLNFYFSRVSLSYVGSAKGDEVHISRVLLNKKSYAYFLGFI